MSRAAAADRLGLGEGIVREAVVGENPDLAVDVVNNLFGRYRGRADDLVVRGAHTLCRDASMVGLF